MASVNDSSGSREKGVDISNLQIGMIFKSYSELAEYIGEQPATGRSKQLRLETWHRYFDWVRRGRKFIITDIYEDPIPKDPRCDALYTRYIEYILTLVLSQKENGVFYTTYHSLYKALNMVGSNYDKLKSYESTMQELKRPDNEISPYGIWILRSQAKAKLRKIVNNALQSMQSRSLIFFSTEIAVRHSEEDKEYVTATNEELGYILTAQQAALKEFNYPVVEAALNSKDATKYLRYTNQYLNCHYGIYNYIQRIKIVYQRPSYLNEVVADMLKKYKTMALEYYNNRRQLNETVVESFYSMIDQSHAQAVDYYQNNTDNGWSLVDNTKLIKRSAQYLFDGEKFIKNYIESEGDGRNGNDWIFEMSLGAFD